MSKLKNKTESFGTEVKVQKDNNCRPLVGEECKEEVEMTNSIQLSQWALLGPNEYLACSKTEKILPTGAYVVRSSPKGTYFQKVKLETDELLKFPDSVFDEIIKEIDHFWTLEDKFTKLGFLHRRGYMFWGIAGGGKTCLVQQICKNILDKQGLVILCETYPQTIQEALRQLRQVEKDRKVVCCFEDIDTLITKYGEEDVLSLLDGEAQIDKVLNIATTNYPEKLDKRIISRPRRFDRVIEIDLPNDETRKLYFKKKLSVDDDEIEKWVNLTKNFTFAAMSELVISVKCLENSLEESVELINDLLQKKISSSDYEYSRGGIGFGKNRGEK